MASPGVVVTMTVPLYPETKRGYAMLQTGTGRHWKQENVVWGQYSMHTLHPVLSKTCEKESRLVEDL